MIFIFFLLNDNCALIHYHNSRFHKLSFPNLVSKILLCDTWYSYTPLQYHVLYTLSGRGVTSKIWVLVLRGREGDQSSSNSRKKSKAFGSQGFQSHGYPGHGRARVASRAGQMLCFHCQQPGHMRRDCPQRQESRGLGMVQSQSAVG